MTITNHEEADDALADALWWFKGFAAAQSDAAVAEPVHLSIQLRNVRTWLNCLAKGRARLLGISDRQFAIVLTEAEFERLWDALRSSDDEVGAAERKLTCESLKPILDQFTRERLDFAACVAREVPF